MKQTENSFFADIRDAMVKGDMFTRLGFIIMGMGCLARKQLAKGLLLLAAQVSYILFLLSFGIYYLQKLPTLGTSEQYTVWDEVDQINKVVKGDNSMLILLFAIVSIALTVLVLYVYLVSIRLGYRALCRVREGHAPSTFREDVKSLFNEKYHLTLLTLPAIGLLAFTVLPLLFMVCMAFTNFDINHQPPGKLFTWTGLETFNGIFGANPKQAATFRGLLSWTIIWAFSATFTCYFGGMGLAILINHKLVRRRSMWRSLFVVSVAVPQFVSLLLMRQLLNDNGTINMILMNWGWIKEPIRFLSSDIARVTVLVVNFWIGVPYSMLITTGILMNIPADLYESARIDGAGPFMMFRKITLPYMMFVTTPYLITQVVANVNNFNVIYLLTRGEPNTLDYYQAGKTDLLITWLYKQTVDWQDYKLASAIGIIIFLIVAVSSLLAFNLIAPRKKEEDFQ